MGRPPELCFRNAVGDDRRGRPTSATDVSRGRTLIDGGFGAARSRCIEMRLADLHLGAVRAELVRLLHLGCRSVRPSRSHSSPACRRRSTSDCLGLATFRSIARDAVRVGQQQPCRPPPPRTAFRERPDVSVGTCALWRPGPCGSCPFCHVRLLKVSMASSAPSSRLSCPTHPPASPGSTYVASTAPSSHVLTVSCIGGCHAESPAEHCAFPTQFPFCALARTWFYTAPTLRFDLG
jgi:hypothetical protein